MARSTRRRSGRNGGGGDEHNNGEENGEATTAAATSPDSTAAAASAAKPPSASSAEDASKDAGEQNGHANGTAKEDNGEGSAGGEAAETGRQDEDKCPACKDGSTTSDWNDADKESWVRCDACKKWFHWRCAGDGDLEAVGKWYVPKRCPIGCLVSVRVSRFCLPCRNADPKRVITVKPPARKSARKRAQRDYAGLQNTGVEQDANRSVWLIITLPTSHDRTHTTAWLDGCV